MAGKAAQPPMAGGPEVLCSRDSAPEARSLPRLHFGSRPSVRPSRAAGGGRLSKGESFSALGNAGGTRATPLTSAKGGGQAGALRLTMRWLFKPPLGRGRGRGMASPRRMMTLAGVEAVRIVTCYGGLGRAVSSLARRRANNARRAS